MTETAYEVRISVWNLDVDNKDHKMMDVFEFPDKVKAYRSAQLWTDFYDSLIHEGKRIKYRIEVTHIERNTYRYFSGAYRCR